MCTTTCVGRILCYGNHSSDVSRLILRDQDGDYESEASGSGSGS